MSLVDRFADELWVCHLGLIPYSDALAIQGQIRDRRQAGELPDVLLLLEHPPTYTRGRRTRDDELPFGEDFYRSRGIEVHATDRGGRVTYHGPGQLVGYPIMAVADVTRHVRSIEAAIVAALAHEGLRARARVEDGPDYTGVWVGERKIASIGVHVARGVSTHGFAVNVELDLTPFDWVIACGLSDVRMTSLACLSSGEEGALDRGEGALEGADELDRLVSFERFRAIVAESFCRTHGRRQIAVAAAELGIGGAPNSTRAARRAPLSQTQPARAEAVPA